MSEQRRDYKSVWTGLSASKEDAHMFVSGHDDEDMFYRAAEDTLGILMDTVGLREGDTVLEIGCGVGRVGSVISPFVKEWIGCDVSPNMLGHARHRLIGLDNIRLQEVSGYDLKPIADASVDVVYTTVVFMHLEEWDRYSYVREAMRVLKPGGRFYCDNMNLASDEGWAVFEDGWRLVRSDRPPQISKFSTVPEFETYLQRTGFTDIHVATRPMWVYGWGTKPPAIQV